MARPGALHYRHGTSCDALTTASNVEVQSNSVPSGYIVLGAVSAVWGLISNLCVWLLRWDGQASAGSEVSSSLTLSLAFTRSFLMSLYEQCKNIADNEGSNVAAASPFSAGSLVPRATQTSAAGVASLLSSNGDSAGGGAAAEGMGGIRLKSFQLHDDDLLGLTDSVILFTAGADIQDVQQLMVEGEFPLGPGSKVLPINKHPSLLTSNSSAPFGTLTALALGSSSTVGSDYGTMRSNYGTPRSPGGSERSQDLGSDYYDVLSPKSDVSGGAGVKVAWVGAHPLSTIGQAVSEADEERESAGGGGEVGGADVQDVLQRKGGFKVVLEPEDKAGGGGKKRRGFLRRLFGRKK